MGGAAVALEPVRSGAHRVLGSRVRALAADPRALAGHARGHQLDRRALPASRSACVRAAPRPRRRVRRRHRRELNTYNAADAVITVSDDERALLGDFLGDDRVFSVPLAEYAVRSTVPLADRARDAVRRQLPARTQQGSGGVPLPRSDATPRPRPPRAPSVDRARQPPRRDGARDRSGHARAQPRRVGALDHAVPRAVAHLGGAVAARCRCEGQGPPVDHGLHARGHHAGRRGGPRSRTGRARTDRERRRGSGGRHHAAAQRRRRVAARGRCGRGAPRRAPQHRTGPGSVPRRRRTGHDAPGAVGHGRVRTGPQNERVRPRGRARRGRARTGTDARGSRCTRARRVGRRSCARRPRLAPEPALPTRARRRVGRLRPGRRTGHDQPLGSATHRRRPLLRATDRVVLVAVPLPGTARAPRARVPARPPGPAPRRLRPLGARRRCGARPDAGRAGAGARYVCE